MAVYALSQVADDVSVPTTAVSESRTLSETRMADGLSLSRVSMTHTASYKFSVTFLLFVLLGYTRFVLLTFMRFR